jgi:phospholipase C
MKNQTTITTTIIIVMIAIVLVSSSMAFGTFSFAVSIGRTTVNGTIKDSTNTTASPFIHSTNTTTITTNPPTPTTPIKHIVIIFQENISFDHYFGTYPTAKNPPNEPTQFTAATGTPKANNLITPYHVTPSTDLLHHNPNLYQPQRIDRNGKVTCNPTHDYKDEQASYDGGKLDKFVQFDGVAGGGGRSCDYGVGGAVTGNQVMDYFDGNTVTALWNYAQHFAMSDNFYGSTFGLSTPGHINLISGNTHGAWCLDHNSNLLTDCLQSGNLPGVVKNTLLNDIDPRYDICSSKTVAASKFSHAVYQIEMRGTNIGDLLNAKDVSWGWFSDGFKLPGGKTFEQRCDNRAAHFDSRHGQPKDYYSNVEPFQYYKSTANPYHLSPTSIAMIGKTDQANHQYNLSDFWAAVNASNMPAVSFIKAPTYQQGHPEISDPLQEQKFLVNTINRIQKSSSWADTAIIVTWDDSGGWYDNAMPDTVSESNDPNLDVLYGPKYCTTTTTPAITQNDKCGYGPRIPMLVISPHAKENFIDHNRTDYTSILKFIEDNWLGGKQIGGGSLDVKAGSLDNIFDFKKATPLSPLYLYPDTGEIKK